MSDNKTPEGNRVDEARRSADDEANGTVFFVDFGKDYKQKTWTDYAASASDDLAGADKDKVDKVKVEKLEGAFGIVARIAKSTTDRGRYQRGVEYFKKHAVTSISLKEALILGDVQGSQYWPFVVSIFLPYRSEETIDEALAACQASGEVSLATFRSFFCDDDEEFQFRFNCTCPDMQECCKHVVALLMAACDRIVKNPSRLFDLRGRTFQPDDVADDRRDSSSEGTDASTESFPARFNAQPAAADLPPLPTVHVIDNPWEFPTYPPERFTHRHHRGQIGDLREVGLRYALSSIVPSAVGVMTTINELSTLWTVLTDGAGKKDDDDAEKKRERGRKNTRDDKQSIVDDLLGKKR